MTNENQSINSTSVYQFGCLSLLLRMVSSQSSTEVLLGVWLACFQTGRDHCKETQEPKNKENTALLFVLISL